MIDLEKMSKELAIKKAETAKMELELKLVQEKALKEKKIQSFDDNIKRIEDHIKLQEQQITKLMEELNG